MAMQRPARLSGNASRRTWTGRTGLWICVFGTWLTLTAAPVLAADWPTYQHDVARSGVTAQTLTALLVEAWVFHSRRPPQPAWGPPKAGPVEDILELPRVQFDDALHVAVADGRVYFGSSADGKLYCLDAESGKPLWTKRTGGPVRLAPSIADGRVYFGSDDGYAYCLDAGSGAVVWRFHAAPADKRVLGNGSMISRWPLRAGVLVDGGVAYLACGIFPAEGVFFYALNAKTGSVLWRNDSAGEEPQSAVSPQGYLLASATSLFAPMGRVSPAALDRRDGKLNYLAYFGKNVGGTFALVDGDDVYSGTEELIVYRGDTGKRLAGYPGRKIVVGKDALYLASDTRLRSLDRKAYPDASNRVAALRAQLRQAQSAAQSKNAKTSVDPKQIAQVSKQLEAAEVELARAIRWNTPCRLHDALVLAGDKLIAGGAGSVRALAAETGTSLWSAEVKGTAKGLAVAAGRLWVSTDRGDVYCFAPQDAARHGVVAEPVDPDPFRNSSPAVDFRAAAKAILDDTGIRRGYCLVAGVETGQLALELVRQSELTVYAISPDAERVAAAAKALDAAGVYGTRVYVDQWPWESIPYSDCFANLIVSETGLASGKPPCDVALLQRMLKPLGGTAVWGVKLPAIPGAAGRATVVRTVRGPIPGAGNWTHQYGNAANTGSGDDDALRGPLEVLWFGQPGPGNMLNRHIRGASPLAVDGRLFVQGENLIMAYDAYNGVQLWERQLLGAFRASTSSDASNLAANGRSLFAAVDDYCLGLDLASGQTQVRYQMPPAEDGKRQRWAYVACDDRRLYGSCSPFVPRLAELPWKAIKHSDAVFALDAATGNGLWTHAGEAIPNSAIALSDGKLFIVDAKITRQEKNDALARARREAAGLSGEDRSKAEKALEKPDVQAVVALDAATGRVLWRAAMPMPQGERESIAMITAGDTLLVFGVYSDGHYWADFLTGKFADRRVTALSAADGKLRWSRPLGYRVRPLVIGNTLHAEPWMFDLATGLPKTRIHPITGQSDTWQFCRPGHHCGCPIGSRHCLIFRSWCLGYYDLDSDAGTMHFGGQRPGCWINAIPAGGLLLMPEASAGCMCNFPNMCSIALKPSGEDRGYAWYSAPGPTAPVRRLGILFGAAGDHKDAAGNLWLGYPRPKGSLVLPLAMEVSFFPGGQYVQGNSRFSPSLRAQPPWRFASSAVGLKRCVIPLLGPGDSPAAFRVRLALSDPDNAEAGQRVFAVKLQGKTAIARLDVAQESGGKNRAMLRELGPVEVKDKLVLDFVPLGDKPSVRQSPIVHAVEVIRE
jgi:outer membrane protein assembly factor BamB